MHGLLQLDRRSVDRAGQTTEDAGEERQPGGRRRRGGLPRSAWVAAAYAAMALALTFRAWIDPQHQLIGTGSDPISGSWAISWVPFAIGHGTNPLFSDYMNSPSGINLFWNNTDGIPLLVLWPVTALWGAFVTFNVAITGGLAASAFTAFLAIRRFVPGYVAAAVGGALYGFSPYMVGQVSHVDLILSGISPPLALLLVHELVVRQRLPIAAFSALTALLALIQYFVWPEILVTEVLAVLVLLVVLALLHRDLVRARLAYITRGIAYSGALTACALALPLLFQLAGPARVQYITQGRGIFVTDALNFIVPTSAQVLAPSAATAVSSRFTGDVAEWGGYLGIPLLLVIVYTLIRYRRVPLVRALAAFAFVLAVLSLGPTLHIDGRNTGIPMPWTLFNNITLVDDVLPARLMTYVFLALGVGLAFVLSRIWGERRHVTAGVLVAAAALVPLLPKVPVATEAPSVPAFFTGTAVTALPEGSVALVLPWAEGAFATPLAWQAEAGMRFRMPDGYFVGSTDPDADRLHTELETLWSAVTRGNAVSTGDRGRLLSLMGELRIAEVIVGPGSGQPGYAALMHQVLGAPWLRYGPVEVWRTS